MHTATFVVQPTPAQLRAELNAGALGTDILAAACRR